MKLSISGQGKGLDPVANATKQGKLPTLGEVKRSLKARIGFARWNKLTICASLGSDQKSHTGYDTNGCAPA